MSGTETSGIGVYGDDMTFAEARKAYFADYGFGDCGGYDARTVQVKLGPVLVELPNLDARKQALPYHDAHHILTGYRPTSAGVRIGSEASHGESEVAAWETGAGWIGIGYWEAWLVNSYAVFIGLMACPGKTFRAFVRGRRSSTLYDLPLDARLLEERLGAIRARVGLNSPGTHASFGDGALFLFWSCAACATALLSTLFIVLPFAVVQTAGRVLRSRRATGGGGAGGL